MTKAERDRIFEENYGLVPKVLRDCGVFFGNSGSYTRDDLLQIGSLGLLKAIDSFRPDRNCKFSTYAYLLIRNELINEVMKENRHYIRETVDTEDEYFLNTFAAQADTGDSPYYDDLLHILSRARENAPESVKTGIDAILLMAQDYSGREIADMLGVRPGNARVCVNRARKYLRNSQLFSGYRI